MLVEPGLAERFSFYKNLMVVFPKKHIGAIRGQNLHLPYFEKIETRAARSGFFNYAKLA